MSVCILFIMPYKYRETMHTEGKIGVATSADTGSVVSNVNLR
jgi:hypothetical protein